VILQLLKIISIETGEKTRQKFKTLEMKTTILLLLILISVVINAQEKTGKTRLVILDDMGNEADEEQQMMHMLMYANEFDLEGLIAVTGKYVQPASKDPYRQKLHPELFHHLFFH
jgi:hypothetical protein